MTYFLGIDIGTSSVKVMLMNPEGSIEGIARRGYDIRKEKLNYAEQDMEELWEATKAALKELTEQNPGIENSIRGIGFSGQMHGLVAVDRQVHPLRPAIIWADQRSESQIQSIYKKISFQSYNAIIGNQLSVGFLIGSLLWMKENESDKFQKIYKVMLPKDYIRYKLCGELGTDASDASSTGIFDIQKRDWAYELMEQLNIPAEYFVSCHESCELAGYCTVKAAEETGLKTETPMVYGGGDSLMMELGNGMIQSGILAATIGTASHLTCAMNQPIYDKQFRTNTWCHGNKDLWSIMGAHLSGGVALKWLMQKVLETKSFDEMTEFAATVPVGSEGLLFLPYLSGERTPHHDPSAKAIYFGLTLKHTKAHIIRAAMEGVVFSLKESYEIFKELGIIPRKVIAAGGGAKSPVFLQIQADMFNQDIYRTLGDEEACMGAAIAASVGTGYYTSYQQACEHIVRFHEEVIHPIRENVECYQERFVTYKKLYQQNKELF
ncbi:MAG: xylulokinase [Lachnospiraceae bacterium]